MMDLARNRKRVLVSLFLITLMGCEQKMAHQPAYRPLQPSEFFPDGRSARDPVPGTVARGQLQLNSKLYQGKDDKGDPVADFPLAMTKKVLERGKERYGIFCVLCHGVTGNGDGRIVQRGFTKPPSYNTDDSRGYALLGKKIPLWKVPVGYLFNVVSNGHGAMPGHGEQIPVRDRWAIVGYVRALQFSQAPAYRKFLADNEKEK
jgi:mono/diheme cytochrome c family protein